MFRSWRLGKIFAIPIYLHPSFLLVPAIALWKNAGDPLIALFVVVMTLSLFGCVLLHELGHAMMARYFGIGTSDITLYVIGGVARLHKMGDNPRQEMLIALAGPAVNLAIVLLLLPLLLLIHFTGVLAISPTGESMELSILGILALYVVGLGLANLSLMVFNLLPIFPMDGGRVLRALLSMRLGQLRATELAARIALGLALLICFGAILFNHPMLLLVALFVVFAGQQELFMIRQRARAALPSPLFGEVPVVIDQEPARNEAPGFQPSYWPREPGFSGFTWDRENRVWVKWADGLPVGTTGHRA